MVTRSSHELFAEALRLKAKVREIAAAIAAKQCEIFEQRARSEHSRALAVGIWREGKQAAHPDVHWAR